jgi:hypothetical protein
LLAAILNKQPSSLAQNVQQQLLAGTRAALSQAHLTALFADPRRLSDLEQHEILNIFDIQGGDRCLEALGALASLGLVAPAPAPSISLGGPGEEDPCSGRSAPAVPADSQEEVATTSFVLVARGVIQAAKVASDSYVRALVTPSDTPEATGGLRPPPNPADWLSFTEDTTTFHLAYDITLSNGWQAYWDHLSHLRLHRVTLLQHSHLFPFATCGALLLRNLVLQVANVQSHFRADAAARAAVAGRPLNTADKAQLCSKYGLHSQAFEALMCGAVDVDVPQRLGALGSRAAPCSAAYCWSSPQRSRVGRDCSLPMTANS